MNFETIGSRVSVIVLMLFCCMLVMACSPATRYRVLTLFFDGVPVPRELRDDPAYAQQREVMEERTLTAFGAGLRSIESTQVRRDAPTVVIASTHAPYRAGECTKCHDMSRGGINDVARDASLCDRCHLEQRQRDGWDHGPINLGSCIPCHVPHQSIHDNLLSMAMTDLCLSCHVDSAPTDGEYHDVENFPDCVACHDPHRMY